MAITRLSTISDATWSRAWEIDTTAEVNTFLATFGDPLGPKRGDMILDNETGQVYIVTNSGSATRITNLSSYEEGTWTPTFTGSGGQSGQVYTTQNGWYVKTGRLVSFQLDIQLSTLGTITGDAQISGLPYASEATSGYLATGKCAWVNFSANLTDCTFAIANNATLMSLFGITGPGTQNLTALVQGSFTNTSRMAISGQYLAEE
jgi:hypothetical protein